MASSFPKLRTDAVAQYPAARRFCYRTQVIQFMDGLEQRFRDQAKVLHQWKIKLAALDDGELAELEAFFLDNGGQLGTFAFTDPWDGVLYPSCSLAQDQFEADWRSEAQVGTQLVIRENRT